MTNDFTIGTHYIDPTLACVRTFNNVSDEFINAVSEQIELNGRVAVCFGVTGSTMHDCLAYEVAKKLPQYDFAIKRYSCIGSKRVGV